jgi:hypothetical protein
MPAYFVVIMFPIALDVGVGDPSHEAGEIPIAMRPKNQMPMIRHQAEAENSAGDAIEAFFDNLQKREVVAGLVEDLGTAIGAVEDMIDNATGTDASWPSHGQMV